MSQTQSSYRQVFKATSLFGGVQVVNIVISILRSKLVAVLLGPAGMGIFGLYTVTLNLINSVTGMGLGTSAVRNVAAANELEHPLAVARIKTILLKLIWGTGLLGGLCCLVLAPWLSKITFGTTEYKTAFYWLAISILFNQLTVGYTALLQGLRKLQYLAKANILGAVLGLFTAIPFYYFRGSQGIVPAIISTSVVSVFIAAFFVKKCRIAPATITRALFLKEGRGMVKMGFLLSLSSFAVLGESYLVRIFISNTGSMEDVGFYNAGFAIIGTYVGMIFTAMGTDYYPRLSMVANSREKSNESVNHQAEIALLILAPILCIFLVYVHFAVIILYSSKFTPINEMIHWAALGMFFKAVSWAIGFLILAKADTRVFFWSELISVSYLFVFNIVGYRYWGLEGLGVSFFVGYLIYFLQVFFIAKMRYGFSFSRRFSKVFLTQLAIGVLCFLVVKYTPQLWKYIVGSLLIIAASIYSFVELNERMGLSEILKKFFAKLGFKKR